MAMKAQVHGAGRLLAAAAGGGRGTAAERGYDGRWQRYRRQFLKTFPLCAECLRSEGRPTAAVVVDHKVPHRGDRKKFWDPTNHQALCVPCHNAKTARGQ